MRLIVLFLAGLLSALGAHAQGRGCAREPACVLDTLWPDTSKAKPHELRGLADSFLWAADASGDAALLKRWSERTGRTFERYDGESFGESRARDALKRLSPDAIRQAARAQRGPWFDFARPDVMYALWEMSEPGSELRRGLVADMREFASNGRDRYDFEARDFAGVIARIGLETCDAALVEEGARQSGFPDLARFRIWAAHARGSAYDPDAVVQAAKGDFGKLRLAVEAYGSTWAAGECPSPRGAN